MTIDDIPDLITVRAVNLDEEKFMHVHFCLGTVVTTVLLKKQYESICPDHQQAARFNMVQLALKNFLSKFIAHKDIEERKTFFKSIRGKLSSEEQAQLAVFIFPDQNIDNMEKLIKFLEKQLKQVLHP